MALITKVERHNNDDSKFKVTGFGFGDRQSEKHGSVSVSDGLGSRSNATIDKWSDTQITGTLPEAKRLHVRNLMVVVDFTDARGGDQTMVSNSVDYLMY